MKHVSVLKVGFALLLVLLLFPPIRSVTAPFRPMPGRDQPRVASMGHSFVLSIPAGSRSTDFQIDYPRLATLAAGILIATGIGAFAFRKST